MRAGDGRAIGGELEEVAGHLSGIAYQLRALDQQRPRPGRPLSEQEKCLGWLFYALMGALEREQARVQKLAVEVYELDHQAEAIRPPTKVTRLRRQRAGTQERGVTPKPPREGGA